MRGTAQVKAFMAKHRINDHDMFVSKFPEHVSQRKQLMEELKAAGLGLAEIGRVTRREGESVRYHLNNEFRRTRLDKRLGRYECGKKFRDLTLALEVLHA